MLKIHTNLIKNLNFYLNFLAFAHQKQKFPQKPKIQLPKKNFPQTLKIPINFPKKFTI